MPFGLWARMGLRNHVLDGGPEVLRDIAMTTIFHFPMPYISVNRLLKIDLSAHSFSEPFTENRILFQHFQ